MNSFRLLTIVVVAAATVPRLAHRGMFVDGITYASIARNLAEGRGRFWAPSYTATIYPEFHEHPPLGFWLQSLWFRAFGDHLFVERAYSMTAAVAIGLLVALIWRRLNHHAREREYEWLPILFLVGMPVVSWSIVGNLLETTVAVFTTAAVAVTILAGVAETTTASIGWGVLSGFCVIAAVLTKGPIGLFPLAAPLLLAPLASGPRRWASLTAQWATVVVGAAALILAEASRASLTLYLNQQVLAALAGRREASSSSLTILKELVQGVALPGLIVSVILTTCARRFVAPSGEQRRWALLLLLLGLAGTLPILASPKQAGHYLVPALPLYAIAAGGLMTATAGAAVEGVGARFGRAMSLVTLIVAVGSVGVSFSSAFGRDRNRLADLDTLAPAAPRNAVIGICPESNDDWGLHAWFERRFLISLDAAQRHERAWFLKTVRTSESCHPPEGCRAITDASRDLVLMRCERGDVR